MWNLERRRRKVIYRLRKSNRKRVGRDSEHSGLDCEIIARVGRKSVADLKFQSPWKKRLVDEEEGD